jgi:hypothetical protein
MRIISSDVVTSFSSYGPYIDFAAPGSGIYTTRTNDSYGSSSGTSFASPITAGAIALVFASDSTLSPDDVYDKLKNSAKDLGDSGRDDKYGWGRIDVAAALAYTTPVIDDISPTVTITSPVNETDVSGIVTVNVDSTDNVKVNKVELLVDGTLYQEDLSNPYSFTINTNSLSTGSHTIEAISYDSSNNVSNDMISVNVLSNTIDTVLPTITITSPVNDSQVNGIFSVSVDAFDDVLVDRVELYVNGVLSQQDTVAPYDFDVDTLELNSGTNQIQAKAIDSSNNFASDQITVIVIPEDILPPTVQITNPTDGQTISGKTTITVLSTDDSGISKVEIFVDGALKATLTGSSFDYTWNAKGTSSGIHTISSIATDNSGNSAQTSIDVVVEKGGGTDDGGDIGEPKCSKGMQKRGLC